MALLRRLALVDAFVTEPSKTASYTGYDYDHGENDEDSPEGAVVGVGRGR